MTAIRSHFGGCQNPRIAAAKSYPTLSGALVPLYNPVDVSLYDFSSCRWQGNCQGNAWIYREGPLDTTWATSNLQPE